MLFKETVDNSTYKLLKRIMTDDTFDSFILVGGTALGLQIGHRKSIDLDFFTKNDFDTSTILDHLRINYNFELDHISKNTLRGEINNIQLDFLSHKYPLVDKLNKYNSIRLASLIEIAAMKLNAITTNGTRMKDFIDIAYLSEYYSLNQMLDVYEQKYNSNKIVAIKSLLYFEEINTKEPINLISKKKLDWDAIERQLLTIINNPNKVVGYQF